MKPLISVVTSSYNMADYLEETIKSVVRQEASNLEYIVIDGGSTDGTFDILKHYDRQISQIICEPDDGQYYGIAKGMALSTGEVMAWLNADDVYMPWTFSVVSEIFRKFPDVDWITGVPTYLNSAGQCVRITDVSSAYSQKFIRNGWFRSTLGGYLQQESMFWRRSLWEKAGGLDLSLSYAADFKLWTEFAKHADLVGVSVPLAAFRMRPGQQRSSAGHDAYEEEVSQVCDGLPRPFPLWEWLSNWGIRSRSLCRLAIWRKSRVVAYCETRGEWVVKTVRAPISHVGVPALILQNAVRG